MNEAKATLTVELTVDAEVAMDKFGKTADKVTMEEYRELLHEALEEAPFQVNISFR